MGKNSHVHLLLETEELIKLKREAQKSEMSVNELIRSKLHTQPVPEEILIMRKLKTILNKKEK